MAGIRQALPGRPHVQSGTVARNSTGGNWTGADLTPGVVWTGRPGSPTGTLDGGPGSDRLNGGADYSKRSGR
jgi:hypothetical protein